MKLFSESALQTILVEGIRNGTISKPVVNMQDYAAAMVKLQSYADLAEVDTQLTIRAKHAEHERAQDLAKETFHKQRMDAARARDLSIDNTIKAVRATQDNPDGLDHSFPSPLVPFGAAIAHLKEGGRVAREGWNGKNMWLGLQVPDAHSKMTLPYIYMYTAQGDLVPWLASQTDILSEDWELLG